ncbi:hypothetical protein EF919_38070 [Streptomyces sp. WAC02707]|uniref:hypothetical protein n=1 Tax=Streptomyces sp. WAC02707 TaxID=2487417 RepID=UPI000F7A9A49|nr:hypothetical protein [Streptomyces sp. WAC02707]RSS85302.1 hypothetical protein EF919_38070 [Streptomyces sp. WAC02707]
MAQRMPGALGIDFTELDQQLVAIPRYIDTALQGVNLTWLLANSWLVPHHLAGALDRRLYGAPATSHWEFSEAGPRNARYGTIRTTRSGTGKESISLGWASCDTVDTILDASTTADFETSGVTQVRELAPRCDDIKCSAPGRVLPFFKRTWTMDTTLCPAASIYYWYMQQVMPDRTGSKRCISLAHCLHWDAAVKNSADGTWTSDDSRALLCDSTRSIHPADASVGPGRLQRVRHSLGP